MKLKNIKQNKRGFLKIVEAFIAIMLIAGAMTYMYVRTTQKTDTTDEIQKIERVVLEEIERDYNLRENVLSIAKEIDENSKNCVYSTQHTTCNEWDGINQKAGELIGDLEYDFRFRLCDLDQVCDYNSEDKPVGKEIIAESIPISGGLTGGTIYNKKLRMFMWEKNV